MTNQTFEEIDAPYKNKHHDENRARKIEILQHLDVYLLQGCMWASAIDKISRTKNFQDEFSQEFINSVYSLHTNARSGASFREMRQVFIEDYSEFINDDLEIYQVLMTGAPFDNIIRYLREKNTYNERKRLLLKIHFLLELGFSLQETVDIAAKTETNPAIFEALERRDDQGNFDINMLEGILPEHINEMFKSFINTGASSGTINKILALNF